MSDKKIRKFDICVIGAGAGGLSVAAGAVQMGASVALIESGKMGGDCLNYGCVPSKSLLAAAKTAEVFRGAHRFGIQALEPKINMSQVMDHVQGVIAAIAPHDSVERFTGLGVQVFQGVGQFIDKKAVTVNAEIIQAKYFVIATGSSTIIPPIPGLAAIPYLSNETIFNLRESPRHLMIIGGGPVGCEMAQAFLMLGIKVTLVEALHILPRDEVDLVALLREELCRQGLQLFEQAKVLQITQSAEDIVITLEVAGEQKIISGSHVLLATGRKPNVDNLNLAAADIEYNAKGIVVDARLRTRNHRVYALGDVIGKYQFTHMAGYHAGIVIRNILFKLPAKVNCRAVPWVTYTHPELAHVGLTSAEALQKDTQSKIFEMPFTLNDRAQAEHDTLGKIKIITTRKGKILGASILGPQAGELLVPWIMAIQQGRTVRDMVSSIIPYPTLNELSKRAANEFYRPMIFSSWIKRWIRLMLFFTRD